MNCERIWLQLDLAEAANVIYWFAADASTFFWTHCKVIT